ncbi:MAG: hypothetical protein QNI99_20070 [Woeseiaceae bacterium]|nr:hypothetical protein [Woeseiaceae bacterium]
MTERFDNIGRDELMAYADGVLSPEDAEKVAVAVEADPALQAELSAYVDSRAALVGAFDDVLNEPVPAHLEALVMGSALEDSAPKDNVTALPIRAARNPWPLALAASAVFALGVVLGTGLPANDRDSVFATGLVAGNHPLAEALETTESGELATVGDGVFKVIHSFGTDDGTLCREYQVGNTDRGATGVACRAADGWQVEVQVASVAPDQPSAYSPASGIDVAAIDEVLYRLGALPGFDRATESCLIESGWQAGQCDPN